MIMEASRTKSRSISPSGNFCSSSLSSSTFSSRRPRFLTRPTSPTRVNLGGSFSNSSSSSSSSIRFPKSPSRSISFSNQKQSNNNDDNKTWSSRGQRKTCACSPTTHPGSFRCSLHRKVNNGGRHRQQHQEVSYHSHGLDARRSAMTNSLVRIGTVEGDLVNRALAALIRPSSHQLRRRADFQPRPSRLSVMSKAEDF